MTGASFTEIRRYRTLPEPDMREILRYAGTRTADAATLALARECISEAEGVIAPSVCFREICITTDGEGYELGFARVCSHTLSRALDGCGRAVLFAATLGIGADRLIARYSRLAPSRAVMLDAVLTERIESLCDHFEREVCEGRESRARFSVGYGDLPLELQRDIFRFLTPEKNIGLTLNSSLLMSPSKSVTAIIPIGSFEYSVETL